MVSTQKMNSRFSSLGLFLHLMVLLKSGAAQVLDNEKYSKIPYGNHEGTNLLRLNTLNVVQQNDKSSNVIFYDTKQHNMDNQLRIYDKKDGASDDQFWIYAKKDGASDDQFWIYAKKDDNPDKQSSTCGTKDVKDKQLEALDKKVYGTIGNKLWATNKKDDKKDGASDDQFWIYAKKDGASDDQFWIYAKKDNNLDKQASTYGTKDVKDKQLEALDKKVQGTIGDKLWATNKKIDAVDNQAWIYNKKNDGLDDQAWIYDRKNDAGDKQAWIYDGINDAVDNQAWIYDTKSDAIDNQAWIYDKRNDDNQAWIYDRKNDAVDNQAWIYDKRNGDNQAWIYDWKNHPVDNQAWIYDKRNNDNQEKEWKGNTAPHIDHMDPTALGFFTLEDLKLGKTMFTKFPKTDPLPSIVMLPKVKTEKIPFSSKEFEKLLQFFPFSPESPQAKAMEDTLRKCEAKPIKGEKKFCATSSESMLDFAKGRFGSQTNVNVLSTVHLTRSTVDVQKYTIVEVPARVPAPKMVACHTMPYPYTVFYCHYQESESRVYRVSLEGENGDRVEAIAVCHMDTSHWSPQHISFRVLGTEPGSSPVCHFFAANHLVLVPSASV